jgi:hypothetical protein
MKTKLAQLRESIALAQEQLDGLRESSVEQNVTMPELDEIRAALFLAMGRANALGIRLHGLQS